MRPVTCCDQICGFRKEAVHPPFRFPSCLAFVERCFLLLSVFVCVWTQEMVMVGMRDGLAYSRDPLEEWTYHSSYLSFFLHMQNFWRIKFTPKSRNGPTTLLCHCFEVLEDNQTSWKNVALDLQLSGPSTCTGHLMFEFKLLHMNFLMGIVSMTQFQRAFLRQNRKKCVQFVL